MASEVLSAPELWAKTVDLVKDRVNHRSLWEAMEKTTGIAIEDDTFIIGLNSRLFNLAGHLQVSEHRNAIEKSLMELTGQPLTLRIIEGETVADWETTKKRDERVAAMRSQTYERQDRAEAAAQSWDNLYEFAARAYSSTALRSLPQSKARYFAKMLVELANALDTLYDHSDESSERHYARVLERVAANSDMPATLVAREVDLLRARRTDS